MSNVIQFPDRKAAAAERKCAALRAQADELYRDGHNFAWWMVESEIRELEAARGAK